MTTTSVVIYRKRNTIICINFSMMFDEMATRILSDIIYPSFIIAFAPYLILCLCQRFVNANRIMTGTPICSKVNNLCQISLFFTLPTVTGEKLLLLSYQLPVLCKYITRRRNPRVGTSVWMHYKHLIGVSDVWLSTCHNDVLGRLGK